MSFVGRRNILIFLCICKNLNGHRPLVGPLVDYIHGTLVGLLVGLLVDHNNETNKNGMF